MKKLGILFATIIMAMLFAVSASALEPTGQCGENVTYTYNSSTGELVISGTGPMYDYGYSSTNRSPFYNCNIKSVAFEDGVTSIGSYAFYTCQNLTSIKFSNTIKSIGEWSFYDCTSLTNINISDNIVSVGDYAFYNCYSLSEIEIGKNASLGYLTFADCRGITNITVDKNNVLYSNDEYGVLFDKVKTSLILYPVANRRTKYEIPNTVMYISAWSFYESSHLEEIVIPESVTEIKLNAFSKSKKLKNITIPGSVKTCEQILTYCESLESVVICDGVINIDEHAFTDCYKLKEVTLPNSIKVIDTAAFNRCGLTDVYYYGSQNEWNKIYIENEYGFNDYLVEATIHFIHSHLYASEITTPANHASEGVMTFTCECGESYTEVIPKLEYKVGDVIEFGLYPQNEIKDEVLIAELNALVPDWKIWTSYGYYSGNGEVGSMVQGDWMRYIDITHNGNKYRGVKFTQYRPYYTYYQSSSTYTYQDDRGYNISTIYWFKFEPLKWRVLDPDLGFVMCETVIDSQPYSDTIYSNAGGIYGSFNDPQYKFYACDYETSSIRKWLNNDFYNTAFSSFEKQEITTTTLNNDGYYTSLGSAGYEELDANVTDDSIFLLSYNEVRNNDFGFSNDRNDYDIARQAYASDYAKFQGVVLGDSTKGNSYWLLRTSGPYSFNSCSVFYDGRFASYQSVSHTGYGVRPALRFEDISSVGQNEHQHNYMSIVSKPTCTENGFTTYNCECGDGYVGDYTDPEHTWSEWTTNVYKQEIRYCLLCGEDEVIGGVVVGEIENLTVIADCTSVYLDWDDVPGDAIGYDVFCKMPDSDSYIVIAEGDVSDVEFSFRDGIYGVFCFKVKPFAIIDDEYYWGEFSEEISVEIGHDYITEVTPPTCTEQGYTTYTCECGNSYVDDYTDPKHTWSDWTTNVYKQEIRYCLLCGEDEVIGEVVVGEVKNLTATVDCTTVYLEWDDVLGDAIGYDVFCKFSESDSYILYHEGDISECEFYGLSGTIYYKVRAFAIIDGEYYIGGFSEEVSVECGHKYESEITILATHLKEGVETFTCHCGDTYTKPIPKLTEHTHIPTVTNPTCTTQGYSTYICECGDSYIDDYVKENGHSYESEITTPATHLKEGVKTFTCECGDSYTESIAKLEGHSYTSSVTKEPTHLAEGTLIYTCECGDTYEKTIGKLGEHSYTSKITKEPTHIAFGETTFTCECGDSYTESIAKLEGHTYTSSVTKEPTHLEEGTLTYNCECGESYTESIEKIKKHTYIANVIAPTCSEKGYTLNACECGDSYKSNYVGMVAHSYKYSVIKPSSHLVEGLGRYTCSECGDHYDEPIAKTKEHSYISTTVDSTCTEQGYTLNECECGDSYKTNYLAKTDHNDSNSDGVCDDCGHDLTENCSCNCHKGGIAGFFFKLILFFQKIFKTNQICEGCGIKHY